MAIIDLTNQKFGRLTVLNRTEKPEGSKCREAFLLCQCECGNQIVSRGSNLRNGNTKSCGCLQKDITSELKFKDLTGQRFGKLVVIRPIDRRENKHISLECKCDCGNITQVLGINLTKGLTKSCGCNLHNSYDIQYIKELLINANIPFEVEKCIKINNQNYYFDILVNNEYAIEYDGKQHFIPGSEKGWNTKENVLKTHQRDLNKNKMCFENNIPIIRIPLIKGSDIQLKDLLLGSQYTLTKENESKYYELMKI